MTKEQALDLLEQVTKIYLGSRGKNYNKQEADVLFQALELLKTLEQPSKDKPKK